MNSLKLVFFYLGMFVCLGLEAKNVIYENKLQVGQVSNGAKVFVYDPEFPEMSSGSFTGTVAQTDWANHFEDKKVYNRIILAIEAKNKQYQPNDYTASVKVRMRRWQWAVGAFSPTAWEEKTLTVNYSTVTAYKSQAVIQLEGGHKVEVEILSITPSQTMNLTLTAQLEVERYYNLNIAVIPEIHHNITNVDTRNELEVSWDKIMGADEYELEWTYVNNLAESGASMPATQVVIDGETFRHNNTRISVKDKSELGEVNFKYSIPLIYEQGFILYRVRALGYSTADRSVVISGVWSGPQSLYTKVADFKSATGNTNNFYYHTGHEAKLNWQSSVTFIEEGKNKVAVSYADGTLRSRQQVSRLNTEDETVVGESVYDHQGRKAVDIIPAPTGKQKIEFTPDFNVNEAGETYSRKDFDLDTDTNCNLSAAPLSTISGASNYYSPENPEKDKHNAYIPDAQKFPFIQTVYTSDNTGRITAQSGIGPDHKIGERPTKYFYGKPLQVEIDRMFGSEAGLAEHYQKNLVVDPNGQVTVTYLDLTGNVVATSLAGVSPTNFQALGGNDLLQISENLLAKNYDRTGKEINKQHLSSDGMSKIYSQELLVSTKDSRSINYALENNKLSLSCGEGETAPSYCFDCVMNVELMLTDKCGKQYLFENQGAVSGVKIGADLLSIIDTGGIVEINNCGRELSDYNLNIETSSQLEIGEYSLSKVITVNKKMLDYYTDKYLALNCHIPLGAFIDSNIAHLDTLSCYTTCELCVSNLGAFDQYDINVTRNCDPCLTYDEYQEKLAECNELCDDKAIDCDMLYESMLVDMSPMGQYGAVHTAGVINPDPNLLSIYSVKNVLPANAGVLAPPSSLWKFLTNWGFTTPDAKPVAYWKNPSSLKKGNNSDTAFYYYGDGSKALVQVYYNGGSLTSSSSYFPEVDGVVDVSQLHEGTATYCNAYAHQLKNVTDFITYWPGDNSWANSLIKYHPEYGSYRYCLDMEASNNFDLILMSSETIDEFKTRYKSTFGEEVNNDLIFNPLGNQTGSPVVVPLDPYFRTSSQAHSSVHYNSYEYAFMKQAMLNFMGTGKDIKEYSYILKHCPATDAGAGCTNNCSGYNESSLGVAEWAVFKGLYSSLKQKFSQQKKLTYSIKNDFYCGCIGDDNWSPFYKDRLFYYPYTTASEGHTPLFYTLNWHSQFYNPKQPCYWATHSLYKNKTPRNPTTNQNLGMGASKVDISDYEPCYPSEELTPGENGFVDPFCEQQAQDIFNKGEVMVSLGSLQTCGECPVTNDMGNLFNSILQHGNSGLSSTNLVLDCYPTGIVEWSPLLKEKIGITESTGNPFKYNHVSTSGDVLSATIGNVNGTCTIELRKRSSYSAHDYGLNTINSSVSFGWNQIKSLCCMSYEGSPELVSASAGKTFKIYAVIDFMQTDNTVRQIRVPLEGVTSCYVLNSCPTTICEKSEQAADMLTLFNAMYLKFPEDGVTQLFTSSSVVELSESSNKERFSFISDTLLLNGPGSESDNIVKWAWQATALSTTQITVEVTAYKTSGLGVVTAGNFYFTLSTLPQQSIDFTKIRRFLSIAPNEGGDPSHNFVLVAEVETSTAGHYESKTLEGYINMFNMGKCNTYNYGTTINN